MGSSHYESDEPSRILSELLRRTLSLVEYYGRGEANADALLELKHALVRAIDKLEADHAAATEEGKPDYVSSLRKGPHGETLEMNRERDTKP